MNRRGGREFIFNPRFAENAKRGRPAYDAAGNRTSKTDMASGTTSNYGYDAIYQLLEVSQGATTTESYSYDAVGNRLSSLGVSPYVYNSSDELTSTPTASYTYDKNGKTLTKVDGTGTTSYTWDFENRLTKVVLPGTGGTVTFKYDPFGRRVQKSGPNGTVNYVYDGANLLEEVDQNGSVLARYTQGSGIDEPLAELRSGTTSYYEQDGLGSVTSLSNGTGAPANTYAYDSYGKLTASTGTVTNPFQYTGREFDGDTGLSFYRARYYDGATGRFLSEDPMQFKAGTNFYTYVLNDPIDNTDPLGLEPENGCKDCNGNPIQGLSVGKQCCSAEEPIRSSAPNPYMPWEGYAGVNAGMMFEHGGDGPWG